MGRKLDALLGRKFKTSKLEATLNLAVSRLSLLKNHHHAQFTIALSDLVQLLRLNHHQQALLRGIHVTRGVLKDENMLEVYDIINGYCHLFKQKIDLIEKSKVCPEELKEDVSGLLYAAPRCGEFPELREIRAILTARFWNEFSAIELRNSCGVSQKMIQKLSAKQPSLEMRMKVLEGIARENGIILFPEKSSPESVKSAKAELSCSESFDSSDPDSLGSQHELAG